MKLESVVRHHEEYEETPYIIALLCYLSYLILTVFGHLRDFMRNTGLEKNKSAVEKNREVLYGAKCTRN